MKYQPKNYEWRNDNDSVCWVCNKVSEQVHHIVPRGFINIVKKYDDPAIFFLICRTCHAGDFHNSKRAWQLALKLKYDPERFDLDRYNELCEPTRRVTFREIEDALDAMENETEF